jgi:hypothetical protein
VLALWLVASVVMGPSPAQAQEASAVGTPAGTRVENTARVSYRLATESTTREALSAPAVFLVDERIQVDVTLQQDRPAIAPGRSDGWLGALVSNLGNGSEGFRLSLDARRDEVGGPSGFDPLDAELFLDDGSGACDEGDRRAEQALAPDATLTLDAGAFALVCVTAAVPDEAADRAEGELRLLAATTLGAATGLPVGAVLEGAGDGGTDAVLAQAGGADSAVGTFLASTVAVSLDKRIVRVDDGIRAGAPGEPSAGRFAPGSVVTYRLEVEVVGTGRSGLLEVLDELPLPDPDSGGIAYVPESLRVGATALALLPVTDADDGAETLLAGVPTNASVQEITTGATPVLRLRVAFDDAPGDTDELAAGQQPWSAVIQFDVAIQ